MRLSWRKLGANTWAALVAIIRATAPDKGQADPPPTDPKENAH